MGAEMKYCKYCNHFYPESSFGIALSTPSKVYRRKKCSACYRKTKQSLADKHYQWLARYKRERGCERCKITDPRVLDFHHKNKQDKLFGIAALRKEVGFQKLIAEIEKSVVLCANCHRIIQDEAGERRAVVYR